MKFYIADAFTEQIFGGNPAGIVLIEKDGSFPDDEVMRKTAAELRYSETAFVKQIGDNEFHVRYFTPAAEVDLCGHATIATFYCLAHAGIIEDGKVCLVHTLAGDINVEVKDGFVMMDMAAPELLYTMQKKEELKELYEVMGANYDDMLGLPPVMFISTGLPDIMLPVPSKEALNALAPDMKRLSALSEKYKVTGVHAFAMSEGNEVTCRCRNFAPLYDIDEEAATGTSNGALTYYLLLNGMIEKKSSCTFVQGESMNRPSMIRTSVDASEEGCSIKVGGKAAVLASGEIML